MKNSRILTSFLYLLLSLSLLLSGCASDKNSLSRTEKGAADEIKSAEQPAPVPVPDVDITIEDRVVCMQTGDTWEIPCLPAGAETEEAAGLIWTSSDDTVAAVSDDATVFACGEGQAVLSCEDSAGTETICVNVFDSLGAGPVWDMDMLVSPDQVRHYRNYAQGAYQYGDYSSYVAMHGCALCCTTTIVRAWDQEEDWTPQEVLARLEPRASEKDFEKNYARSPEKQMPLTLKGISRVLTVKEIPHNYVTRFDIDTLEDDLADCLRQGNPVIYEAGRGGYHMLLLLGMLTDGRVLVSDSVGEMRVRITSLNDVADQMFSCKKEPDKSYFSGRQTAGGYIVCGD